MLTVVAIGTGVATLGYATYRYVAGSTPTTVIGDIPPAPEHPGELITGKLPTTVEPLVPVAVVDPEVAKKNLFDELKLKLEARKEGLVAIVEKEVEH